jgi:hypothetical protein
MSRPAYGRFSYQRSKPNFLKFAWSRNRVSLAQMRYGHQLRTSNTSRCHMLMLLVSPTRLRRQMSERSDTIVCVVILSPTITNAPLWSFQMACGLPRALSNFSRYPWDTRAPRMSSRRHKFKRCLGWGLSLEHAASRSPKVKKTILSAFINAEIDFRLRLYATNSVEVAR